LEMNEHLRTIIIAPVQLGKGRIPNSFKSGSKRLSYLFSCVGLKSAIPQRSGNVHCRD
jgi:hypothetical protein